VWCDVVWCGVVWCGVVCYSAMWSVVGRSHPKPSGRFQEHPISSNISDCLMLSFSLYRRLVDIEEAYLSLLGRTDWHLSQSYPSATAETLSIPSSSELSRKHYVK
jgi:hypothetical protein